MAKRSDLTLPGKIRLLDKIMSQPPQSRTFHNLSELVSVTISTIGRLKGRNKNYVKVFQKRKESRGTIPGGEREREREREREVGKTLK